MTEDMVDLVVTSAPHVRKKIKTSQIMRDVLIALVPATVGGLYFFGTGHTLGVIIVAVLSTILAEYLGNLIFRKKSTLWDFSSGVTGLLLALVLPPSSPYWMVVVGAFSAIFIGKIIFGGIGSNPFNPALVGRAVLMVSWPTFMTTWLKPFYWKIGSQSLDAITSATPLNIVKLQSYSALIQQFGSKIALYKALFIGNVGGCIGETSALLLLIGGIYLLVKKVIDWRIPFTYIISVFVFSFIFGRDPLFSILAGGLFLGAFFMATDYSSSPVTPRGKIIFGIFIGFVTVIIRRFSSYPEGIMFSILLGNAFVTYFDRFKPHIYGVFAKNGGKT
jgi:electron transport complex protein RnfD